MHCNCTEPEYNAVEFTFRKTFMDPENAPSIVLPIAILIAVLAACGIVALALLVVAGVMVI